jgi:glutaredoxin
MNATVVIYSTPSCHFCHMAKEFFAAHGVPFTDHDVAQDLEKRKEMIDVTGQMGVPVIIVTSANGEKENVIGFDEGRLRTLLDIKD